MIDSILKILSFSLFPFSLLGIFYFYRKNRLSIIFPIISILVFSILWRQFTAYDSSRYYLSIIILGIFFSLVGIQSLCLSFPGKTTWIIFLSLSAFLMIHSIKLFSPFSNIYVLEINDRIGDLVRKDSSCEVIIDNKEFKRLSGLAETNSLNSFDFKKDTDLSDHYIRNSKYKNSLYYVVLGKSEDNQSIVDCPPQKSIVEHHFTNSGHRSCILIIKHDPFTPSPDFAVEDSIEDPVLKAYEPSFDAFVYQSKKKLYWFIGKPIDNKVEIIYHLYTNEPSLLPESRVKYTFDNRGFRPGGRNELKQVSHYRVFEKDIPQEYPITKINVGFNDGNSVTWTRSFQINN